MNRMARRLLLALVVVGLGLTTAAPGAFAAQPPPRVASCLAQGCAPPLVLGGAGVAANAVTQRNPTVRIVFWGPKWTQPNRFPTLKLIHERVITLFKALAANAPASAAEYNEILDQYLGGAGTGVPVYGGWLIDATTPPLIPAALVSQQALFVSEIDRAIAAKPGWTAGVNTQFMVFLQPGTKFASAKHDPTLEPDFCAYHDAAVSATNGTEIFDVEPYIPRAPNCGSVEIETAMTATATHEYAEAATDPFGGNTSNTTLSAGVAAGSTCISTAAAIPVGSTIVIGAGATQERHNTTTLVGPCTTVTLTTPMVNAQVAGAAVVGQQAWTTNQASPPSRLWEIGDLCESYMSSTLGPTVGAVQALWSNAAGANQGKGCVFSG